MEIRNLDRDHLKAEYGAFTQRLMPWTAMNAPFEGAWCVIAPGTATAPHSHHEHEMFIAISGVATLESDGRRDPFVAGDVAYLTPGEYHQVINDSDTDFQMYSVWWDPELAHRFAGGDGGEPLGDGER
jgi:mannose-6-phosphate isomerase-like protein (cupin superfamily)